MKDLRTIRIFLSALFLTASVAYLCIGSEVNPMAQISMRAQIIPSALAATVGITLFWLAVTFFFGRMYCSTVCPVGALQDTAAWFRRRILKRKGDFSYKPRANVRLYVLAVYAIALPIGLIWLSALVEPWNILKSAARLTNPELRVTPGLAFAGNAVAGGLVGLLSLICVWIWALAKGRRFCSHICPIGTFLESIAEHSLYQIRIDPDKCTSCMACERNCKSEAIKVSERFVDNGRCVRCFDCHKVCPEDAIRLRRRFKRPATPEALRT
ncbi:MAG: 4Fe-4S binding protein [Muribaculaceae bacterium]|nr:4Fe-4S binding protein [Muribaculaceae bacterium]